MARNPKTPPPKKGTHVDFLPDPNSTAYKEHKKKEFLDEFPKFGAISPTAKAINVDPGTVYDWLDSTHKRYDQRFEEAFRRADQQVIDQLKNKGIHRALSGSDVLLMFFLKNKDAAYRDRVVQELDEKTVDFIVNSFIETIQKKVDEFCPNCKTHLKFKENIAKELIALSSRLPGA